MKVLIAEDDAIKRVTLQEALGRHGYEVDVHDDGLKAYEALARGPRDLVVADLKMPAMDGIELLRRVRREWPATAVIIMTAFGTVETAVEAMRLGATDYVTKPFLTEELILKIEKIAEVRRIFAENERLRRSAHAAAREVGLIGKSPAMERVFELIEMAGPSETTILIEGESGTGKQVAARAIHLKSPRSQGPFVVANCAVLSDTLLEDELFGHEKGAFTGATSDRAGRFERAAGGTLFLDDIDDMKPDLQVKLLQVLQERTFERLGGTKSIRTDVRVVAATKKDLAHEVAEGRFRDDLYYRLNVVTLHLPPLRERPEDIAPLAATFLHAAGERSGKGPMALTEEALGVLLAHPWPGNVRQLENAMEYAAALARSEIIHGHNLPRWLDRTTRHSAVVEINDPGDRTLDLNGVLGEAESRLIQWALDRESGNKSKAAKRLGIPRTTLIDRMAKLGLPGTEEA